MTFNHEQVLKDWTALSHLIDAGAYEECSSYHYETGTWPDDSVEESLWNLEKLAGKEGLGFRFHKETKTYTLEPLSPEELAAMQAVLE